MTAVLDASAVLAWLQEENGAEQVHAVLDGAQLSTVNASEVAQKLLQYGADGAEAVDQLVGLGVALAPFTGEDALVAAELWPDTHTAGLSLGDRACLALAQRLDRPVLTADQAWKVLELDVEVQLIR